MQVEIIELLQTIFLGITAFFSILIWVEQKPKILHNPKIQRAWKNLKLKFKRKK